MIRGLRASSYIAHVNAADVVSLFPHVWVSFSYVWAYEKESLSRSTNLPATTINWASPRSTFVSIAVGSRPLYGLSTDDAIMDISFLFYSTSCRYN